MRIQTILSVFIICLLGKDVKAQFTLSAEIRPRTEMRNGFKTPGSDGDESSFFTEQRTRLNFNYVDTSYTFRISLQDIRIWGENAQIFKQEDGNTFLSEAWFEYPFNSTWTIKAGRQIISYDNQRYMGGLEWAQQGRRHDALLFKFRSSNRQSSLDIGLAFNSDDDIPEPQNIQSVNAGFYSVNNYKYMQYLWYNRKTSSLEYSFMVFNLGFQDDLESVSFRQTLGMTAKNVGGTWRVGGDAYYQMGKSDESDVSAYLLGVNLTYQSGATPWTIGIEHISGKDDDDTSGDVKHFRPDFGTNHAHNGYMDYFFVGPSNGTVGVTDLYIKTKFKIKKAQLSIHGHHFLTGSNQFDLNNIALSKSMGTEIDFVYSIPLKHAASLNIGYSFLLASDTMKVLRNRTNTYNSWTWMMFTIKPVLLKS